MYKVIGSPRTRTFRVLWLMEELGLPYEFVAAPPRSEEARAHNPSGKVPALVTDEGTITDSTAILTFLADRHGAFTHPAGTIERARQDAATHFLLDEFDAVLWTAARHSFVLPEEHRLPAIKDSLRWEFERAQHQFLPRMAEDGPFLMGEEMTIPDILLAHCMSWAINARFPVTDPFRAHATMMRNRPAFERAAKA